MMDELSDSSSLDSPLLSSTNPAAWEGDDFGLGESAYDEAKTLGVSPCKNTNQRNLATFQGRRHTSLNAQTPGLSRPNKDASKLSATHRRSAHDIDASVRGPVLEPQKLAPLGAQHVEEFGSHSQAWPSYSSVYDEEGYICSSSPSAMRQSNSLHTAALAAGPGNGGLNSLAGLKGRLDNNTPLYVDEHLLEPIVPAPTLQYLQHVTSNLTSKNWKNQFDGLTTLRRLAKFHCSLLSQQDVGLANAKSNVVRRTSSVSFINATVPSLADLIESLRSNVAKNAMLAVHDLYMYVGMMMSESVVVEPLLSICLKKAGISSSGSFLHIEAEKTLLQMYLSVTSISRLLTFLLKNFQESRTNQKLKSVIAQSLAVLLLRAGDDLLSQVHPKDVPGLVSCCLKLSSENSNQTRRFGKFDVVILSKVLSTKARGLASEAEFKELHVAARLAKKSLDVTTLFGVSLADIEERLAADESQQTHRFIQPAGRLTSEGGRTTPSRAITPPNRDNGARNMRCQTSNPGRNTSPKSPPSGPASYALNTSTPRPVYVARAVTPITSQERRLPSSRVQAVSPRRFESAAPQRINPVSASETPRLAGKNSIGIRFQQPMPNTNRAYTPDPSRTQAHQVTGPKLTPARCVSQMQQRPGRAPERWALNPFSDVEHQSDGGSNISGFKTRQPRTSVNWRMNETQETAGLQRIENRLPPSSNSFGLGNFSRIDETFEHDII